MQSTLPISKLDRACTQPTVTVSVKCPLVQSDNFVSMRMFKIIASVAHWTSFIKFHYESDIVIELKTLNRFMLGGLSALHNLRRRQNRQHEVRCFPLSRLCRDPVSGMC